MFQLLKRIPLILAIPAIVIIGGWIIFQAGQNSTAKEIELISNAEAKDNTQKNNTTEDEVGISRSKLDTLIHKQSSEVQSYLLARLHLTHNQMARLSF